MQNVYGSNLLPQTKKAVRDRVKQILTEEMAAAIDSLGCCLFTAAACGPEDYAKLLADATGKTCLPKAIVHSGAAILQLERALRCCNGQRACDG